MSVGSNPSAAVDCLPYAADNSKEALICGGGSESTIIIGPSKSVLVYALHSLEYDLGLARLRVFGTKFYYYYYYYYIVECHKTAVFKSRRGTRAV